MTAISVNHLTRRYGRRRGIVDLSFDVAEGEAFGFLGPNGAGKTTTIRVLMGFLRPSEGLATIFGRDCWRDAAVVHRDVAFVGSEPSYLGELPAAEQLDFLAQLRGLERGAWRRLAERLELDPTVPIRKLSRGNRQKVGVIQAFMGNERLLVMDEPTSGLDPVMQREFLVLVAEARGAGRTVFLSSHNLPEVERSCDRVGIVREGRLVDVTSVQALLASHWRAVNLVLGSVPAPGAFALPNVRVLAVSGQMVHLMVQGEVNELLRRIAQLDVRDVSIATPDIEDVFLGFYEGPASETARGVAASDGALR
jgi:ABC-type multidrug transport system, ATPase component